MTRNSNKPADPRVSLSLRLTQRAVEKIEQAICEEGLEGHGLRVGVMEGGSSSLRFCLDFASRPLADDFVLEQYGVRLFVDPFSAVHLQDTLIDFVEGPQGRGFEFQKGSPGTR